MQLKVEGFSENKKKKTKFIFMVICNTVLILVFFMFLPSFIRKKVIKKRNESIAAKIKTSAITMQVSRDDIIKCLKMIKDPEFNMNIYDLGIVKSVNIDNENNVNIILKIYRHCPYKIELYLMVRNGLQNIKGIKELSIKINPAENMEYLKIR
ncbi:MAG: DUF59 domain-containing protein [Candidatus Aureabacteria bacterium]|nr:DUF59 domain-containing protein [Candidatus Auribacterota bacterium]